MNIDDCTTITKPSTKTGVMNVLWYSRHEMTQAQINDLKRIYNRDVKIIKISVNARGWRDVYQAALDNNCEVMAVILPQSIIDHLIKPSNNLRNIPVIRSISTGKYVTKIDPDTNALIDDYVFEHNYWEQVLKIDIVTKRL